MGKYDVLDKQYFGTPERLAELISQGVYHGKLRVLPEDLEMLSGKYLSLRSRGAECERDGICLCRKHGVKYGLEIEKYSDKSMPRRILTYDACEYEKEAVELKKRHKNAKDLLSFEEIKCGMREEDEHFAILNCVLFLGIGHYQGGGDMREYLQTKLLHPLVSERVQNYSFAVIEADYVDTKAFHTELSQVFEALQARGKEKRLKALFKEERFQNLSRETQKIISLHLNQKEILKKVVEEDEDMCKAMRDWERHAREEGRVEGKRESYQSALKNLVETLHLSLEQAMDVLRIPEGERALYRK